MPTVREWLAALARLDPDLPMVTIDDEGNTRALELPTVEPRLLARGVERQVVCADLAEGLWDPNWTPEERAAAREANRLPAVPPSPSPTAARDALRAMPNMLDELDQAVARATDGLELQREMNEIRKRHMDAAEAARVEAAREQGGTAPAPAPRPTGSPMIR